MAEKALLYHNLGRVVGDPSYALYVVASNYRIPELSAALLLSQLERLPEQTAQRMKGAAFLADGFRAIGGIETLKPDPRITQRGYYFFVLRYDRQEFAGVPVRRFTEALKAEGVPCGNGYGNPLHKELALQRERLAEMLGRSAEQVPDYLNVHLPVSKHFCAEEQVTFPQQLLLADRDGLQTVLDAVAKIKERAGQLADA